MAIEAKTSHADLMQVATELHEATGGAPVEVRDGTRVVKIGPWPAKDLRQQLAALIPVAMDWMKGKPSKPSRIN